MHVHIVALADIPVQRETPCCAFTTKAYHLTKMLRMRGHHVTLYACEGSDKTVADKTVICVGKKLVDAAHHNAHWEKFQIYTDERGPCYHEFCRRVRWEIPRRSHYGQTEPVCLVGGWCHPAVVNLPPSNPYIESGIGYPISTGCKYRVFESYFFMSWHWGRRPGDTWHFENPFDVVIPNAFDPAMFTATLKRKDYGLFVGRVNEDKGWRLAMEACKAVGLPLKIVGQLPRGTDEPKLFAELKANGATWEPPAGIERRRELMGRARVFFCPTQYNEPFGGVAVEAMMSGCPVVTSDWGAFTETVVHGLTGFRCHSVREMIQALGSVGRITPATCRDYAVQNYSLERISHMYDAYLENVAADVERRAPTKTLLANAVRFPPGYRPKAKATQRKEGA